MFSSYYNNFVYTCYITHYIHIEIYKKCICHPTFPSNMESLICKYSFISFFRKTKNYSIYVFIKVFIEVLKIYYLYFNSLFLFYIHRIFKHPRCQSIISLNLHWTMIPFLLMDSIFLWQILRKLFFIRNVLEKILILIYK